MFTNPVVTDDRGENHGDPFVLRHGGEFFLYHHPFGDSLFYNVRPDASRGGNVVDRLLASDRLAGDPAPVVFPSERWEGS